MSRAQHRLTREFIKELCDRLRAGAFEQVAAESLGVPQEEYRAWLDRGAAPGARGLCRRLYVAAREARAHARLMAEMDVRAGQPKAWLLHGPGRDGGGPPGWSQPPRARPAAAAAPDPLASPQVLRLLAELAEALTPYPDAGAAVLGRAAAAGVPGPAPRRNGTH